ncbi:MAG: hypothetical protein H6550_07195 [Chitinophagales bacterium]|nr:hypothetical protein [Chitinophagales bacterium]
MGTIIEKEQIPDVKIVPAFVDKTEQWEKEMHYAARLGNEFKGKTTITFETTQGPRSVTTTVWSVTNNFIQLKGGLNIPLNSVIDIHF